MHQACSQNWQKPVLRTPGRRLGGLAGPSPCPQGVEACAEMALPFEAPLAFQQILRWVERGLVFCSEVSCLSRVNRARNVRVDLNQNFTVHEFQHADFICYQFPSTYSEWCLVVIYLYSYLEGCKLLNTNLFE